MTMRTSIVAAFVMVMWASTALVHGQSSSRTWALRSIDSTGFVPAERLELTDPLPSDSWWKRTAHNHLFDFSDADRAQNLIVVDPVVQAYVGRIVTGGAESETREWWDNIRGARFQGRIDRKWHLGGELLERQGIAEPLLGRWAVQYHVPGWGRSKLGKGGEYATATSAYFDVMLTRGWIGWQQGRWAWDAGVDALHIGAGRNSAFLSRTAVPAPYLRATRETAKSRTSAWSTRWMSTRRGPLGETAESLLERTRSLFLTHQHFFGPLLFQAVYNFSWETTPAVAEGGWEGLGFSEGQSYRPTRHIGGLELQWHQQIGNSLNATAYAQQSWSWMVSTQSMATLSQVAGLSVRGKKWNLRAEWAERTAAHCRACHIIEDGSFGPVQADLTNAGLSVHSLWQSSTRLEGEWHLRERLRLLGSVETNELADAWMIDVHYQLQPAWPLRLWIGTGGANVFAVDAGFEAYRMLRLGVHAGVMNWR